MIPIQLSQLLSFLEYWLMKKNSPMMKLWKLLELPLLTPTILSFQKPLRSGQSVFLKNFCLDTSIWSIKSTTFSWKTLLSNTQETLRKLEECLLSKKTQTKRLEWLTCQSSAPTLSMVLQLFTLSCWRKLFSLNFMNFTQRKFKIRPTE